MAEKIKLYDTSKCTACRGCQLACKQWNQLAARQTRNRGSYQNPPDLQPNTYLIIRFQDVKDDKGGVKWFFRKEACMHCTEAACVTVCPSGALYYTDMGTVGINQDICIACKDCVAACPSRFPSTMQDRQGIQVRHVRKPSLKQHAPRLREGLPHGRPFLGRQGGPVEGGPGERSAAMPTCTATSMSGVRT